MNTRILWPRKKYRSEDNLRIPFQDRLLWPRARYRRPEERKMRERLLWPDEKYRPGWDTPENMRRIKLWPMRSER